MTEKVTIRTMIRNLMAFNPDAEFKIMDDECKKIPINDFNFSWRLDDGGDRCEDERDIFLEKITCKSVTLYPNIKVMKGDDVND